jgi:ferredoxin-NADP reductase
MKRLFLVIFKTELLEVIQRTANVFSFRFTNPMKIDFKPGQYSILIINKNSRELKHTFSMSNSPTEEGYLEYTTMIRDTEFKKELYALQKGDSVDIDAPHGNFIHEPYMKKIGMLAGGLGITPFRSIVKYCTDKNLKVNITLLYGACSEQDIIFRDDFMRMQRENIDFKVVYILEKPDINWKSYVGYINEEILRKEIADYPARIFFCCGPPSMLNAMNNLFDKLQIEPGKIRREDFTGY